MKRYFIIAYILLSTLYANSGIISGFISDSSSGEALIGANVFLKETGQGMATDLNGYYIIQDINPGNYTLMVSYVGFDMYKKKMCTVVGMSLASKRTTNSPTMSSYVCFMFETKSCAPGRRSRESAAF